ncbi:DUF262 domain-containing protein [bacterium]|nr:DUF262 domain-containing protein [bacterium]
MRCITTPTPIGKLFVERNMLDENPVYQRESGVWSPDKQQLFIDSIFNCIDIPKFYLHDLHKKSDRYRYAIIDGKQRLHAVWEFLESKVPLAKDFEFMEVPSDLPIPKGGDRFADLSEYWREWFKSRPLDLVFIQDATEDDIEELFSRLNNGEPLNAAEKRNAMGGDMVDLIRRVAELKFFKEKVRFKNSRYSHLEAAAKILLIEKHEKDGASPIADLKKKYLDDMVRNNKVYPSAEKRALLEKVSKALEITASVFSKLDPLLDRQAYIPLYHLFVKSIDRLYAGKSLKSDMRKFLLEFNALRASNLQKPEEDRDPVLIEFGRLMQQGTNDSSSLRDRLSTLTRYFLALNPSVERKDRKRAFSEEERLALYHLCGGKCQSCGREFSDISEMDADHVQRWSEGGVTSLSNGRALCTSCNRTTTTSAR